MSIRELCRPRPETFLDTVRTFDESKFIVFGAPMDLTGTYRRGSRFAPGAIRRASRYMESYSLRLDLDGEDIPICDVGIWNPKVMSTNGSFGLRRLLMKSLVTKRHRS